MAAIALLGLFAGILLVVRLAGTGAGPSPGRAIAVLPFTHPGREDEAYFASGLADEVRTLFTRIGALQVAAPASVARIADRRDDLEAVRTELGVDTVLDGSIRSDGRRIRITAQLVDARTGFQLWARSFDRERTDVLDVQREIAGAIVRTLRVELLAPDRERLAGASARDPEAYDLYLRARFAAEERTEAGFERAVALYGAALDLDPDFPMALAGLARAWSQRADFAFVPSAAGYGAAERAAERALALDPEQGEALHVLGWVALYGRRDLDAAGRFLDRALRIRPGDASLLSAHAALDVAVGRPDDAVGRIRQAVRLDPLSPGMRYNLAYFAFLAGDLALADRTLDRLLAEDPGFLGGPAVRAQVALARGDVARAAQAVERETHPLLLAMGRALVAHARGDRGAAGEALAAFEAGFASDAAYQIAQVHAFRGDREGTFAWLDRALAQDDPGLLELRSDPYLASLRDDPRYDAFRRRAGLMATP